MRSHESFSVSRLARRTVGAFGLVACVGALGAGCLTRPVQPGSPTLKTNFTTPVKQKAVDKLDILFMIDNSASMGDKQAILSDAVPDLMSRLVTPNCVDQSGQPIIQGGNPLTTSDGTCPQGKAEFQPVHDMHLGIVSSSIGGRGSDACPATGTNPVDTTKNAHNDDSAHLLDRGGADEHVVNPAIQNQNSGSFFLAWFPTTDANTGSTHPTPAKPETDSDALKHDFADLVTGVHEYGCGYEASLESWYRFLIQPDPYAKIAGGKDDPNGVASLVDVDVNILQQRADFLRDDSLVAVIVLTDENESTVDPLALGGQGWAYENTNFPGSTTGGGAAKGTSACANNPNDDNCTSCGFCRNGSPASVCNDTVCKAGSYYTPQEDSQNERFFHMKQRFGVDPRFPITRYQTGLTSPKVPDRNGEHPADKNGVPSANYVGTTNCVNPLFAKNSHDPADSDPTHHLPTTWTSGDQASSDALCNLTPSGRDPGLIYFAAITGVPWQLLTEDPANAATSAFKSSLTDDDWTKLIGKDPMNYDFTGANVHMLESTTARAGIGANDPIVGNDYVTNGSDLEYACTFPLTTPKDCTDPNFKFACDCTNGKASPLCDPANLNRQIKGKAYPAISELSLVRLMGDQGIVASLCPKVVDDRNNADYGYRPAVRVIIDRLKNALANQCLPQPLTADKTTGEVPCLILLTLTSISNGGDESACDGKFDRPAADILKKFRDGQAADWKAAGGAKSGLPDPSQFPVCQLKEIVEKPGDTCANEPSAGWCYVTNSNGQTPAGQCAQAILFTQSGNPAGASIFLECVESNTVDVGTSAGAADGG